MSDFHRLFPEPDIHKIVFPISGKNHQSIKNNKIRKKTQLFLEFTLIKLELNCSIILQVIQKQ